MSWAPYTASMLSDLSMQLSNQAKLLEQEAERLRRSGPDAQIIVNYQLSPDAPLVRSMGIITQFVGAIVASAGHAAVASLAGQQDGLKFENPRKRKPKTQ